LARLLESYGEQAGGSVAISLAKFQIPKSNLQTNPNIKILDFKGFEHWCFDIV
jgi:hypothetical protein